MKQKLISTIGPIFLSIALLAGTFLGGMYVGQQSHAAAVVPGSISGGVNAGIKSDGDFSAFWKTWRILDEKFVSASTSAATNDQDRVWGAISGMVSSLGDPYTVFLPPAQKKSFDEDISGNFEGVGMEVGVKDDIITVISPLKNTPAFKAGILAGDKIISINGTTTQDMRVDEAVKLMRGKKGTTVVLKVLHVGKTEPTDISIVRDVINIPTTETEIKPGGIFVIRLYNFSALSANQFRAALKEFVNTKSNKLVLDLRGNPGGYLESAVDMASWFLPPGKVVVRENFGSGKAEEVLRSKGYDIFNKDLKMVILINGGSASASEILAGALSEHGKATLVGTQSFGKGSVQELIDVTPETSVKVTIAQWLTPNGLSISATGIKPDIEVKMTEEDIKAGRDPQLDKALEILKK